MLNVVIAKLHGTVGASSWDAVLLCQIREGFLEKMFKRAEEWEGIMQAMGVEWNILGKRNSMCKGPDLREVYDTSSPQEMCWA